LRGVQRLLCTLLCTRSNPNKIRFIRSPPQRGETHGLVGLRWDCM
jgi:hypothetical protein